MHFTTYERELKKRLAYPYIWGQPQTDDVDRLTNFIYDIPLFDDLLDELQRRFGQRERYEHLHNYALNRWFNFWSAMAVEQIFCTSQRVQAHRNTKDRLIDFHIDGIQFDHKTSVYPKGFRANVNAAQRAPTDLITWLYAHQSQQQRKHLHNRLFIVLHASDGAHWRLKAEISWMKTIIESYVHQFDAMTLPRFTFEAGRETLADVIWACT